ncbi:hypothetical protein B0T21DRAFT_361739 [Apiosordaria backusii]|uniref:Uncharacterized protein n=1 Tax=Apiosordaria backusii TaxID=314023 RepID=A0AA40BRG2_9PEZI|nr:hypothetical protein B0T21DRAFT_361739 [Apiosordaria backusii]
MPDFSMTFTNASNTTFKCIRGETPSDPVLDTINQSPAEHLTKFGTETLSWSQAASTIATFNDASVYWEDPNSNKWFGVKIHAPVQIFTIGTAPYYQVSYYDGNEKKEWYTPVDDPSTVFTFPDSVPWKVIVRPTAAHTTLYLSISISDK